MGGKVFAARDKEEYQIILNELESRVGIHARYMAQLVALWGLRISDFLNITWEQVEQGFNTGAFDIVESKTGKKKAITMTKGAINILTHMRQLKPKDVYLFQSRYGRGTKPIDRQTAWRWMSDCEQAVIDYRRKNGLLGRPNLGTHSLRKSGSRLRIQGGAKIEDIQQFLNHANPATTIVYLDNNELDLEKTFELGDSALFD